MAHETQYPRRRDVRDMLLQISSLLEYKGFVDTDGEIVTTAEAETDYGLEFVPYVDFDREFLAQVRDLMRDGADLAGALFAIANAEEVEEEMAEQAAAPMLQIPFRAF